MKLYLSLMAILAISHWTSAQQYNVTCFYDTFSIKRGGSANFTENDLRRSLEYCNQIVYGYIGFSSISFSVETLHGKQHLQFAQVKKLKNQYRNIKFLVSLGGEKDMFESVKYLKLLEAPDSKQQHFIKSAKNFLKKYHFDGLDLAYQFPTNKIKKSSLKNVMKQAKNVLKKTMGAKVAKNLGVGKFTNTNKKSKSIMKNHNLHKHRFTELISKLKNTLRRDRLMLTLTVLPHVNVSTYINVPSLINDLDFVNLATFDYSTPRFTPKEADYLAPLNKLSQKSHNSSVETDVNYWISQHFPRNKLGISVAAFGRTWRVTKALKSDIPPIRSSLDGPGLGGEGTHTQGLLSRSEICSELPKMSKKNNKNLGSYAYRTADLKGSEGLFITYEDEENIAAKINYVKRNSLGGVALFDLSLDDFRGKCKKGTFPILNAIKHF
ncbi:chitinase-like protein Idgf3 [Cochliomyia hominivorax]